MSKTINVSEVKVLVLAVSLWIKRDKTRNHFSEVKVLV